MLGSRSGRRRPHYGPRLCAVSASVLLLLSVYLLHSRLSFPVPHHPVPTLPDPSLLDDPDPDPNPSTLLDRIDELDTDPVPDSNPNQDDDDDDDGNDDLPNRPPKYRFDHVAGVVRRPFDRRSIDQWDDYDQLGFVDPLPEGADVAFGSDDVAVDEEVRRKVVGVRGVEDALLLVKGGGMREGWGKWFEAKSDFLRRDRMFRSNLEGLNPLNNPMLQDPDGAGGISRGDRVVMKGIWNELRKVPFLVKRPLGVDGGGSSGGEVASRKKPVVGKSEENRVEDLRKKGRGIASVSKPLLLESLGNGVEDLATKGRGIASVNKPVVVKGSGNVVEDLGKKDEEVASTKKLLVVKNKEDVVEDLTNKGKEIESMEKPLVIKDATHELGLKTEHGAKAVERDVEDLIDISDGLASVKTEEMSTMKKPLVIEDSIHELRLNSEHEINVMGNGENILLNVPKPLERRALYEDTSNLSSGRRIEDSNRTLSKRKATNISNNNIAQSGGSRNVKANAKAKPGLSKEVYANGKRWGYFPGLHPRLSFSKFMDAFFRKGKCSMRVFMVWNSPPWAFTVRHQRGLESLLFHHRDACLIVFSETIELNFFDGFVKEGFKVAVAMPNLDELLKDTPTSVFASVWFEWRKATFYSTHYSELIRLAALYKYGGIYLDSDVIVLKRLSSFNNSVGLVDLQAGSSLNGAVMSFRKHSPFMMECLTEFYMTYDDTKLRWNGADLLTRVANNFSRNMDLNKMELKLQHSSVFFPISRGDIRRYFSAPETEIERAEQNILLAKILKESSTFHFWNSLTSALIPDPESLVAKIINQHCIHCNDVL